MTAGINEDLSTAPEIFVPDVDTAVEFFTAKLGFAAGRVAHDGPGGTTDFAVVAFERSVLLVAMDAYYLNMGAKELEPRGRAIDTRIVVRDVDAVYERAKANGVRIVHDIADRPYGLRDFVLQDPWGFRWRFATPIAAGHG